MEDGCRRLLDPHRVDVVGVMGRIADDLGELLAAEAYPVDRGLEQRIERRRHEHLEMRNVGEPKQHFRWRESGLLEYFPGPGIEHIKLVPLVLAQITGHDVIERRCRRYIAQRQALRQLLAHVLLDRELASLDRDGGKRRPDDRDHLTAARAPRGHHPTRVSSARATD